MELTYLQHFKRTRQNLVRVRHLVKEFVLAFLGWFLFFWKTKLSPRGQTAQPQDYL